MSSPQIIFTLLDTQRLEISVYLEGRPAVQRAELIPRRSEEAGVPRHLPEWPHSRDRRSRQR